PMSITGPTFTFTANENGGGVFSFSNDTGQAIVRLDFFATLPAGSIISCTPGRLETCTIIAPPNGGAGEYLIILGPALLRGGIANGDMFAINLNDNGQINQDPNGSGGWFGPDGAPVTIHADVNVPEPFSCLLIASGAALIGTLRHYRWRKLA
ncbi:MAG: hypothetical protein JOZ62_19720, partial [Acidobacteriaceae bacterium]|nr:hypothetical protein [Acidobacteriaceae bacterium]